MLVFLLRYLRAAEVVCHMIVVAHAVDYLRYSQKECHTQTMSEFQQRPFLDPISIQG